MKRTAQIYLDNASTTPIDSKVLGVMMPYLKGKYGNPSSLHHQGRMAKSAIEKARQNIASILNSEKDEIIFTSGGTESDNLAILGIARAYKNKGRHIIVSCIEHKAVLDPCKKLEKEGFEITYLDVDKEGIISLEQLKSSIKKDTILVSIMYANNEIGTIQSIKKISKILKESISTPIFHCDACQASGALSLDIKDLGVDALTISSSKIYGPKGIGCLYLNKKYFIDPVIIGGSQERGLRSGTENVAAIVGFAEALVISEKKRAKENQRLKKLRDYFLSKILSEINGVSLNGDLKNRLPNNLNISIRGVEGESLVLFLDSKGIYCSTGSACSSSDLKPSYVLRNIGVSSEFAHCSIRLTLGRHTRKKDLNYVVRILSEGVNYIRSISTIK
ncbi:MAG: cysteine desulfurase family protein [Candidatus Paceibacterota bacterium]|jgi:cysteine desulfurase